jgi:Domain of unknown function (DUF1993)
MYPLSRQVQLLSDTAKGACARLAGLAVPSFADTETTFPELKGRIAKTLDFIATVRPDQIDGSEARDIFLKAGAQELTFKGQDYLVFRAPELLLPRHRRLRDPAPQRAAHRQARLSRRHLGSRPAPQAAAAKGYLGRLLD